MMRTMAIGGAAWKRITLRRTLLHLVIVWLLFMLLYPLGMTIWGSFKSELGFQYSRWYPTLPLAWGNYKTVFPMVWRYIVNTVFVAFVGTTGNLIISSLSAFTFARMKFPLKEFIYTAVIALMMIPGVLSLVPTFMLYKGLGVFDTYAVLILPIIVSGPIFGTFLLRGFFEGIPEEIFEAARMDGATEFKIYRLMCLPMSIPILGTLAIMTIMNTWNDILWPMVTIKDESLLTVSAGLLVRFTTLVGSNYQNQFAGYMMASVPLILLFVYANKYYIEGMAGSSVKL
ncbi:carbohydrate ABC transporter permease [Cohnella nanjingensis]|uniref:Carbohydrate ABC transporter permease n=2 Tax=Cohnella nanjingensis TaxID=1387779 RepID=A0A7X0RQW5_9BACL|nr:carbohydrate ABC transporter permease [Cohnella nanjingensis]